MTTKYNPKNTVLTINGQTISGIQGKVKVAHDADRVKPSDSDTDGNIIHVMNPSRSGKLTIPLSAISPSASYINSLEIAQEQGAPPIVAKLRHLDTGRVTDMSGGSISKIPDHSDGNDGAEAEEFEIHFSKIIRTMGGGSASLIETGANIAGSASQFTNILG